MIAQDAVPFRFRRSWTFGSNGRAPWDFDHNTLLSALPLFLRDRWVPHFERVQVAIGQILSEPNRPLTHVYFPTTAIISLLYELPNGVSTEVAVVGNEGMLGVPLLMGGDFTHSHAIVTSAGACWRLEVSRFKEKLNCTAPVPIRFLRYIQALMTQIAQTAVCNRHHCIVQQVSRRLLMSLERSHGNELVMTQDLIARTLGVRREGVTKAAQQLQKAGIINYTRGRISVLDRAGLEAESCECYGVIQREYARLLCDSDAPAPRSRFPVVCQQFEASRPALP